MLHCALLTCPQQIAHVVHVFLRGNYLRKSCMALTSALSGKKMSVQLSRPTVTQRMLSLWIALYIGGMLNAVVWQHKIMSSGLRTWADIAELTLSLGGVFAFTLLLLGIAGFGGQFVYRIIASIMVLFSAAASYYMSVFNVVIGYGVMLAVLTTEFNLSRESVGWHFLVWLIPTAVVPVAMIWITRLSHTTLAELRRATSFWRPLAHLMLICMMLKISLDGLQAHDARQTGTQEMANAGGMLAHRYLPSNWIAGLGMVAYHKASEAWQATPLFDPASAFTYVADPQRQDTTVIFVIGETTRADHIGLLGYERDTTPLLSREKNLVAMQGWSCDSSTYLSLRCMFVREGGTTDDDARTLKERNVFATLKSLGFSSELFSVQSEVWFYNSIGADNYLLREMIAAAPGNEGKPVDDMLLIPPLAESLANHTNQPHVVVLHTKGSHYLYSQRYPRSFAHYTPECFGIDETCSKEKLVNSFDNSILYIDTVLTRVIDQVRDRKAIVFYTSDHGESIDDGTHFHATPRHIAPPEQRRVPVMVWMSDPFLETTGGRTAHHKLKARAASGQIARHEELFDSILGCTGFNSPDGGIVPKNNWCH
jgi:KDO II ethanolaminephosphotransferase